MRSAALAGIQSGISVELLGRRRRRRGVRGGGRGCRVSRASSRTCRARGVALGRRQVGAPRVEPLVLGQAARASPARGSRGSARGCRASGRARSPRSRTRPPRAPRARPRRAARAGRRCPAGSAPCPTEARIAGVDELRERAQPLARRGGARLGPPPDLLVERRHRERDRDVGAARGLGQHVDVAHDQRAARDQPERVRSRRRAPRCSRASAGSGPRRAGTGRWRRRSRSRSPCQEGRASSRRSTSATFTFTRIEVP